MTSPLPGRSSRFVVITGLSGSGKSTVLKAMEDLGFYAVDNLPVELLPAFVKLPLKNVGEEFRAALGMDIRDPGFVTSFPPMFNELSHAGFALDLLYLETDDATLIRRFSQTRRQHPLAQSEGDLAQGIARERRDMLPIRRMATQVVDTTRFNIHELRQEIFNIFAGLAPPALLQVNLITFGFKYGLPPEADMVIDVRFLDNPYFVDDLRGLDGRDQPVVDYLFKRRITLDFLKLFQEFLDFLLPLYRQEGKTRLTLAVGCTGGRHRSVAIAEWLAGQLAAPDRRVTLRHRDINLG
ncbi:MAG: RNase adapter RapZ [Deltaproteobacteria bacterium]|nr:RNase adapter RapZ [Deltaproteobacteria bacterium]